MTDHIADIFAAFRMAKPNVFNEEPARSIRCRWTAST